MIGRAGAMIGLYIAPFILSTVGHGVTVSWEFGNFRSAVAVFWDAMAMLVLGQFAAALLRNRDAFQT
jgi:hypothetical protein